MNATSKRIEPTSVTVAGTLPGVIVGHIVGIADNGAPIVTWGDRTENREAVVAWMPGVPDWKKCEGLRVVLAFDAQTIDSPVVLGLLDAPPTADPGVPETLRVESEKELVIECGKAKIALRADGRIEIRGGHLVSRSSGPNKIKGSSVHIN